MHTQKTALRVKRLGIWKAISWDEYRYEMMLCGLMLQSWGIQEAEHVAILSDNRPEWLFADLGIQLIAARSVGIYQTNTHEDVNYITVHKEKIKSL